MTDKGELATGIVAPADPAEVMNELHADIGRKAAELALQVLESIDPKDIPVASAVALLRFGVELERKALLGVEDDGGGADPFETLAKTLTSGQTDTPKEG